jgi:hypothetical protein
MKCDKWFSGKEDRWAFARWNAFAAAEWLKQDWQIPHSELHVPIIRVETGGT